MTTTSAPSAQPRQIARARITELRKATRQRERKQVPLLAAFLAAQERRRHAELDMAAAVSGLFELDATVTEIADLTELTPADVRRLRKLANDFRQAVEQDEAPADSPDPQETSSSDTTAERSTETAETDDERRLFGLPRLSAGIDAGLRRASAVGQRRRPNR